MCTAIRSPLKSFWVVLCLWLTERLWILCFQKEDIEPMAGYLSLHQNPSGLSIKWTPNQLMNGCSEVEEGNVDRRLEELMRFWNIISRNKWMETWMRYDMYGVWFISLQWALFLFSLYLFCCGVYVCSLWPRCRPWDAEANPDLELTNGESLNPEGKTCVLVGSLLHGFRHFPSNLITSTHPCIRTSMHPYFHATLFQ